MYINKLYNNRKKNIPAFLIGRLEDWKICIHGFFLVIFSIQPFLSLKRKRIVNYFVPLHLQNNDDDKDTKLAKIKNRWTDLLTRLRCYSFISAGENRFLSRCKHRHFSFIFQFFYPFSFLFPYYLLSLQIVRGEIRTIFKHLLLFRVEPKCPGNNLEIKTLRSNSDCGVQE